MPRSLFTLAGGAALAATALAAGLASPALARPTPQERLDKLLVGRVAGEPVNCINLYGARSSTIIDRTAIVYDTGGTIYVNRPSNPEVLDDDSILITRIFGGGNQLCNLDIVRLQDRTSFFFRGTIGLQKFVPYKRVAKAD